MRRRIVYLIGFAVGIFHLLGAIQSLFMIRNEIWGPLLFITAQASTLPAVILTFVRIKMALALFRLSVAAALLIGIQVFTGDIQLYQFAGILVMIAIPNSFLLVEFQGGSPTQTPSTNRSKLGQTGLAFLAGGVLVAPLVLSIWFDVPLPNFESSRTLVVVETLCLTALLLSAYRSFLKRAAFWLVVGTFLILHTIVFLLVFSRVQYLPLLIVVSSTLAEFLALGYVLTNFVFKNQ